MEIRFSSARIPVLLNYFDLKSVIQCCDKTGRRGSCRIRDAPEKAYQMTFDFA